MYSDFFNFSRFRSRRPWRGSGLLAALFALALAAVPLPAQAAKCYQSKWLAKQHCTKPVISKVPYAILRDSLEGYFAKKKEEGQLVEAGVYFRDLEGGPHFGVNEYTNFAAASLLKLPIVIQYLNLIEEEPALMQQKLTVPEGREELYDVAYAPPSQLVAGQEYSVEDLLYRAMAYSDNLAFYMLRQNLAKISSDEPRLMEWYRQLGLVPEVADGNYVISVARYASMFKLIYNATYLNAPMSEKLLSLLLESTFDNGLEAGLPKGVRVAHKFGVMASTQELTGVLQLHDCGIVYYPDNPYVLCVMTRGYANPDLEKIIGEVSRMVYMEVDSRRGRRK